MSPEDREGIGTKSRSLSQRAVNLRAKASKRAERKESINEVDGIKGNFGWKG